MLLAAQGGGGGNGAELFFYFFTSPPRRPTCFLLLVVLTTPPLLLSLAGCRCGDPRRLSRAPSRRRSRLRDGGAGVEPLRPAGRAWGPLRDRRCGAGPRRHPACASWCALLRSPPPAQLFPSFSARLLQICVFGLVDLKCSSSFMFDKQSNQRNAAMLLLTYYHLIVSLDLPLPPPPTLRRILSNHHQRIASSPSSMQLATATRWRRSRGAPPRSSRKWARGPPPSSCSGKEVRARPRRRSSNTCPCCCCSGGGASSARPAHLRRRAILGAGDCPTHAHGAHHAASSSSIVFPNILLLGCCISLAGEPAISLFCPTTLFRHPRTPSIVYRLPTPAPPLFRIESLLFFFPAAHCFTELPTALGGAECGGVVRVVAQVRPPPRSCCWWWRPGIVAQLS